MKYQITFIVEDYPGNELNNYMGCDTEILQIFNNYVAKDEKDYSQVNVHRVEFESLLVVEAENREDVTRIAKEIKTKLEKETAYEFQVDIFDIRKH